MRSLPVTGRSTSFNLPPSWRALIIPALVHRGIGSASLMVGWGLGASSWTATTSAAAAPWRAFTLGAPVHSAVVSTRSSTHGGHTVRASSACMATARRPRARLPRRRIRVLSTWPTALPTPKSCPLSSCAASMVGRMSRISRPMATLPPSTWRAGSTHTSCFRRSTAAGWIRAPLRASRTSSLTTGPPRAGPVSRA